MNRKRTAGDLAEMAGSEIGHSLLKAVLSRNSQAERFPHVCEALKQLCEECDHRDRAIGGFAVMLVNLLEQGLGVQP